MSCLYCCLSYSSLLSYSSCPVSNPSLSLLRMHENATHKNAGIFFGTICWFWVFYRCREDGAVVLGLRHPWEHAPGDHDDHVDEHHDFHAAEIDKMPEKKH